MSFNETIIIVLVHLKYKFYYMLLDANQVVLSLNNIDYHIFLKSCFFLREEYIKFIPYKNDVGECRLHLSQGRWIPITEPQNRTDISTQQCCIGTISKFKDCNEYVSAV